MKQATTWNEAVEKFWEDVQELLRQKYHHASNVARAGLERYQQIVDQHGFAGAVYNQGEEETAAAIDAGIRKGFPDLDTP